MATRPTIITLNSGAVYDTASLNTNFLSLRNAFDLLIARAGTSGTANQWTGDQDADGHILRNVDLEVDGDLLTDVIDDIAVKYAATVAAAAAASASASASATSAGSAATSASTATTKAAEAAASALAAEVAKMEWQGAWSAGTYQLHDVVEHNGSSWIAISTTSAEPTGILSGWELVALKGTDGVDGADGADGADGIGAGDVLGPASSVDSHIVQFNGTGGKTIKDGLAFSTDAALGASDTTVASQNAIKTYVDNIALGLQVHASCRVATTAALSATYVAGVLTNNSTLAALSIDGVSLASGNRVLVKDQASQLQNGTYVVTTVGSGAVAWVLTRASDMDVSAEVSEGMFFLIEEGTVNNATAWIETGQGPFTLGTTAIVFTELRAGVVDAELNALAGLTSAAGKVPYFTGSGTAAVVDSTSYGRAILNLADQAALQTAVGGTGLPTGFIQGLQLSNGTDATNDIDITVGKARNLADTADMVLAGAITKQLDANWAVGSAAGGRDTGSIANGMWAVWLIKRTDTSVVDVLFSTSFTAPTMPTNYDQKRLIGAIKRENGYICPFVQSGDSFEYFPTTLADHYDRNSTNSDAINSWITVAVSAPPYCPALIYHYSSGSTDCDSTVYGSSEMRPTGKTGLTSGYLQAGTTNFLSQGGRWVKTNGSHQIDFRTANGGANHWNTVLFLYGFIMTTRSDPSIS